MKAWILHNINDIHYEDIPTPELQKGEVLVSVKAAGICGSDIPRIYTTGAHVHPLIPGHEFSGSIVDVFSKEDRPLIGKRVGIFPLIPCGRCPACRNRHYQLCRSYNYLGSRCNGGFAQYAAVPKQNLIEIPENVSYEAAAMLEPMAVAAHAIRLAERKDSDPVVVIGLGTIGLLLTMQLISAGYRQILVVGNKEFQKKKIVELGIHEENYFDSRSGNATAWIQEHTSGMGATTVFECVGQNAAYQLAVECAGIQGNVILVGNPHADMSLPKDIYWKILRNELTVRGSWNSSFTGEDSDDWHYVLQQLTAGSLNPEQVISHRFFLEELETGLHIMRDKQEPYAKVMIEST